MALRDRRGLPCPCQVVTVRELLRAAAALLADLPPRVVGLGVLIGIAGTLWACLFF